MRLYSAQLSHARVEESFLDRLFRALRRLPAFIGAFVCALLIWFFVSMTKRYTSTRSIPLVVRAGEAKVTARNALPRTVNVKFEGEGWKILSLYFTQTEWVIDLSRELAKEVLDIETTKNAAQYIKPLPDGLSAIEVQPTALQLLLDAKLTKRVPIVLATPLEPATGYTVLENWKMKPDSVTLTGARSIIGKLNAWETSREAQSGIAGKFKLEIVLSDTLGGQVEKSVQRVSVTGISEQLAEVEFRDVPVQLEKKGQSGQVTLIPNKVSLVVVGAISELAQVRAESLSVRVSLDSIAADTLGSVSPEITLPIGVKLLRQEPERLQYILRK